MDDFVEDRVRELSYFSVVCKLVPPASGLNTEYSD
jgi:hypothetical protein